MSGLLTPYLKKRFHNAYHWWWTTKHNMRGLSLRQQGRWHAQYHLRKLTPHERRKRVEEFVTERPEMRQVGERLVREWDIAGVGTNSGRKVVSGLWTWNGDWGVLRPAPGPPDGSPSLPLRADGLAAPRAGPMSPSPWECGKPAAPSLDPEVDMKATQRAAREVMTDPRAQELWVEVQKTVQAIQNSQCGLVLAWAMEVCPRTLECKGEVRVHIHIGVFCARGNLARNPLTWLFMGQPPSDFSRDVGQDVRGRRSMASISYLALPKVCTVFAGCSQQLFTDLPVPALSVFNGVQARKILTDTAHELLCRVPKQIDRNLDQLARYRQEQANLALERVMDWRRRHGSETKRPWRMIPLVLGWRAQYSVVLDRYQFLVLDGPSRMGKTAYARSLVAPEEFLEVSLAGGAAIDLRAYRMWKHTLILFDEADPAQIVAQKKLFQAGPMPVQLQTSTTNCHAYTAYVGGKMLVVCSNVWMSGLRNLCHEDHEWLVRNSVYVHVDEPMWVQ